MPGLARAAGHAWRKSTRCVNDYHCVEVSDVGDAIVMRNSQWPGVFLTFSKPAWQELINRVKTGELDIAGR
jgi:hypothetical protein